MPTPSNRPWVDQVDRAGRQVADRTQELLEQGQTRRLVVRDGKGKAIVQLPLLIGLVAAAVLTIGAPWLVVLGGLVGFLAGLRLQVVLRRTRPPELPDGQE